MHYFYLPIPDTFLTYQCHALFLLTNAEYILAETTKNARIARYWFNVQEK